MKLLISAKKSELFSSSNRIRNGIWRSCGRLERRHSGREIE